MQLRSTHFLTLFLLSLWVNTSGHRCLAAQEQAGVIISEFMAANKTTLEDGHGDTPDWIELYNPSDVLITLDNWALTDNKENLFKWLFPPGLQLQPHAHLVVFASNKDRDTHPENFPYLDPDGFYHTNFSLGARGEYLALVRPDGQLACEFQPAYPTQYDDLSYGWADRPDHMSSQGYLFDPTPGQPNSMIRKNLGPFIESVTHEPSEPTQNKDLIITARVTESALPILNVWLLYCIDYANSTPIQMNDKGLQGDVLASDQIYTGIIPASAFESGDMVRWVVQAIDLSANLSRYPLYPHPAKSPAYYGTVILDPSHESALPILHWFLEPGQESAANSRSGTRASLSYDGRFYDNIFVRIRGGSVSGLNKKSYKFEFNTGHPFYFSRAHDPVDEININTTYTDKTYVRQCLAFDVYDWAGVAAPESFPILVQRNQTFFSVANFVEQPDSHLLKREGLDPAGALYKMYNGVSSSSNAEKKTRHWEDRSDLKALVSGINTNNETERTAFIFDNINIPQALNYLAASVIIQNDDDSVKNYYLYRDTNGSQEWLLLPWDLDLTFGKHYMSQDSILTDILWADKDFILGGRNHNVPIWPSHPFVDTRLTPGNRNWNRLTDALLTTPKFVEMVQRRLRTLMDEILQPATVPLDQRRLEARLDDLAADLASDVDQDREAWGWYGQSQTLDQAITALKHEYLDVRRSHLFVTHNVNTTESYTLPGGFSAEIPDMQPAHVSLDIGGIEVDPGSGNQDEEFIELKNPNVFAVDISGWSLQDAVRFTFAPGTVIPAGDNLYVSPNVATFRTRDTPPTGGLALLVVGNYQGHLSKSGETLTLVDANGVEVNSLSYVSIPSGP